MLRTYRVQHSKEFFKCSFSKITKALHSILDINDIKWSKADISKVAEYNFIVDINII